jgi:hypothetical protein
LRSETRGVAKPVFLVEYEEIETSKAQDLDNLRLAEHRPAAEHLLAVAQPLFQCVDPVHVSSPRLSRRKPAPLPATIPATVFYVPAANRTR